ncbi:MAG: hypothetical protein GXO98_04275 [Nitrospirae bacterium]|nr:hypothetical protein [Nitrospirota bacterium]
MSGKLSYERFFWFHINQLSDKISLKNIEYYNVNETVFEKIINALISSRSLRINYYFPYKEVETKRTI